VLQRAQSARARATSLTCFSYRHQRTPATSSSFCAGDISVTSAQQAGTVDLNSAATAALVRRMHSHDAPAEPAAPRSPPQRDFIASLYQSVMQLFSNGAQA
jgi:hypothetical protein